MQICTSDQSELRDRTTYLYSCYKVIQYEDVFALLPYLLTYEQTLLLLCVHQLPNKQINYTKEINRVK